MSDKERVHVLLDDPTNLAVSLQQAARVVAENVGEHPADVGQRIRYGGGMVARDVSEAVGRQIARGLAAHGLGSFIVPRAALRPAPRPRRIGALLFDAEGIGLGQPLRPEKVTRHAWSKVRAIHAHALTDQSGSEEREALPRRGGNLRDLSPDARKLINDIREHEEKDRSTVRLGIDLLVGDDLYRIGHAEPGTYAGLDLPPIPDEALMRGPWAQVADAGDAAHGKWVEWEGVVAKVVDRAAGLIEVGERAASPTQLVRLRLSDPREVALRRLEPGVPVAYRGRIDGWDGPALLLGAGALRRGSHSLENYLLLVRKLLALAPASVMIPPTTRRFAERALVGDVLYAKREELDAFTQWVGLALSQGIRFGEPEELADDGLVDADEAELVEAAADEEIEDVDDAELEPGESARLPRLAPAPTLEAAPPAHEQVRSFTRAPGEAHPDGGPPSDIMAHFGQTGRLNAKEILAAAAELETLEEEGGEAVEADPEVAEAMSFFDQKSGQWRLKDVLSGAEELERLDEEL